jgi:hypothetical protein
MICRYCGLRTDGGVNHGASRECVAALTAEAARLRIRSTQIHKMPCGDDENPAANSTVRSAHASEDWRQSAVD